MSKITYAPNSLPLGMSSEAVIDIFDLHNSICRRLARDFKHPDLDRIEVHAQGRDGFFSDYHNGGVRQHRYTRILRRMRLGDMIFGQPEWAIALRYLAVRPNEPWDIEGRYTYEDRKGNTRQSTSQAKYRLDTISLIENDGYEGCLEPEFSALGSCLRQFEEITETLPAWIASGYGMQVLCRNWSCDQRQTRHRVISRGEIARLAERVSDLDTLRDKLHCTSCGQNRPDLLLSGKLAGE
ncbi:MAG: hypothetical protein RIE24_13725 [Silicimonas sp.]